MKKIIRYISMAALAMMGTIISGCAGEDVAIKAKQQSGKAVTLTTTISLGGSSANTRALDADGKKTFAVGDQIAMFYKNTNDESIFVTSNALKEDDISSDKKTATITFDMTGMSTPKAGGQLRYVYPHLMAKSDIQPTEEIADAYTIDIAKHLQFEQDGTLENLSKGFDLAVYDGNFTSEGKLPLNAKLNNKLAIVEFTFKDYDGTDITSTITNLIINQGPGLFGYEINRAAAAGPIYVAMMPSEKGKEDIDITASDGKTTYVKTAKDVTLAANDIYPVTTTLLDMLHTPLTLEATEDETEITITNAACKTIQYRVNGKDKISITNTENITGLKAGDIVQFFSTNASLYNNSESVNIKPSKKTYLYGNAMSLIDDGTEGFAKDKAVAERALKGLFKGAANIYTHDSRQFVLPATDLQDACYYEMFVNCTSLNNLPEDLLPATTAPSLCYNGMFAGCTSLTAAPKLPAEVLSGSSYQFMFLGCTSLTAAPDLPATTLKDHCYYQMFEGCTSLTTAPEIKATTLADYCCSRMFAGCTSLTTAPELKAEVLTKSCYASMFEGCTSLTTAPTLAANTLVKNCYDSMFKGCSKLGSVTCLATTDQDNWFPLSDWLSGAGTAEGITSRTLYINPATTITDWQLATSGNGNDKKWTTSNYVAKSRAIGELTTNQIGWRLGNDGVAYEPAGKLPDGVKAEAVIAYVGSVPNYFDNFLAIALEDVDNNNHVWADALNTVGTYAAAHPITIGGTVYNTSTTGSTYYDQVASDQTTTSATRTDAAQTGWRLPSVTDWRYIIYGFGDSRTVTPTNPSGISDEMSYGSSPKLYNAINAACGNNALQYHRYWSSSEYTSNSEKAWNYCFRNNTSNLFLWNSKTAGIDFSVRAVFAY